MVITRSCLELMSGHLRTRCPDWTRAEARDQQGLL